MATKLKDMNVAEMSAELGTYTQHMSDEWQEAVDALRTAASYTYCYSEKFNKVLENELRAQLKYIRDHALLEELSETYTKTYTTVKWLD